MGAWGKERGEVSVHKSRFINGYTRCEKEEDGGDFRVTEVWRAPYNHYIDISDVDQVLKLAFYNIYTTARRFYSVRALMVFENCARMCAVRGAHLIRESYRFFHI